ncbi:hypothetical protein F9C43_11880 [Pseudomonas aeruginosa]|nr:hypothetical protein [Pseudomonas aeruginosa]QII94087.1 hypothetical protein F9C43_11880 [Pseudomonas aeruginosa]
MGGGGKSRRCTEARCGQHTDYVKSTLKLLSRIEDVVGMLKADLLRSPFAALQCAREFLWLVGHGVMATLWLRALSTLDGAGLPIDKVAKRSQGQFYFSYVLPDAELRISRLEAASGIEQALKAYPVSLNF